MKKTISAALLVASVAAQAHDTTLYGSVRMNYTYSSFKLNDVNSSYHDSLVFSRIGNADSRFGIKGEDDLGNGLTAFYKYENRFSNDEAQNGLYTHYLYVGLKGGFGSFSIGKQDMPTEILDDMSDPFNRNDDYLLQFMPYFNGLLIERNYSNSAVYMSPNMGGLQLGVGVVANGLDGSSQGKEHIDAYNVAVKYATNGFYAGVGHQVDDDRFYRMKYSTLAFGYGNENFEVGLLAEKSKLTSSNFMASHYNGTAYRLGAKYNITESDSVYAKAEKSEIDYNANAYNYDRTNSSFGLGYQHKFSARTRVWAEYQRSKYEINDSGFNDYKITTDSVSIGLRTDF